MTPGLPLTAALVLAATAFVPRSTRATTYQWDGGVSHGNSADANWSTGNNWVGGAGPASSLTDTDVEFLGTAGQTTSNNDSMALPGAIAIHSLTFDAGNTAYTLTGNVIYLGAGGLVQNSTAAQTFSNNVSVVNSESWTYGAGAGALNFANGLTIADGGNLTVNNSNIHFTGSSGLTVGGFNGTNPNYYGQTGGIYTPSSFTLTGGATLSPASVTIGIDGTGENLFTQDSGTLNTGAITLGNYSYGTFHLSGTGAVSATSMTIGQETDSAFVQENGSVTTNGGSLTVGFSGGGSYCMKGGSLSTGEMTLGVMNNGFFSQANGTVTVSRDLGVGMSGNGTYQLGGGNLTAGSMYVGLRRTGEFIQTGGSVTVAGAIMIGTEGNGYYNLFGDSSTVSAGNVIVGTYFGAAVFTVDGGSVNIAAGGSIIVGNNGSGTFTQNGGTVTVAPSQGSFVSLTPGSSNAGTYNLNGGVLNVGGVRGNASSGTGGTTTFNFNGGVLQANASSTTFVSGLTHAYVQAGGVKIDSNGQSITIPQALLHDPALVGSATDGGLTKLGTGLLILSGANTFNGGTLIAGGMLEVALDGALGTGSVTLGSNAFQLTLDANVTNAIADTASLSLDSTVGGKLQLLGAAGSIQETVASLDFNGMQQAPGTYGATGSGAEFIDDIHFSGTGILAVGGPGSVNDAFGMGVAPEPGTNVLTGAGILLVAVALGRRRCKA